MAAVASAVFSISILSLGSAKDRPITDTDVQSDERPLALPRHPHGAARVRVALAVGCRVTSVMTCGFGSSLYTTDGRSTLDHPTVV
eukprot:scaffold31970_cov106-Isochrysis_galbana.AAC.1